MTHELHLGSTVPENPKNQGLALKAEELEDSEPDEEEAATLVRRMKRLYRNLRPGNQKGRNSGRRTIGSKSGQGCFKCGDPDHQIRECPRWEYEKGKGEDRLKERCNKPTFSKPKKAMIAAWGDVTDSEDDDDQPEKETANLCLMAKIDGTMQDPSNEVSSTTSQSLSNNRLIESPIETLVFFEKLSVVKEQSNKALEPNKDHMTYLNNVRYEVQGRFLELPVRNNSLKDSFRRVKNVHTILDETNNANEVQETENFDIGLIRLTDNDEEDSPAELHKKDQGEQVENNLEFQVQEEQVENNLGFHVQEEQANQEVPIREEQAEKTGVSVQEEQEGLKWMLRNKLDEHGPIARLVVKRHNQQYVQGSYKVNKQREARENETGTVNDQAKIRKQEDPLKTESVNDEEDVSEKEEESVKVKKVTKVEKHAKEKKGVHKSPTGGRRNMWIATKGTKEAINIENKEKEQASQPKDVVPNPRVVLVPPPTAVPLGFSGFGGFSSFGSSSSSLGSQKDPSIVELKEQVSQLKEGMARMMAIQEGTDARISELQSQVGALVSVIKEMGSDLHQLNAQVTTSSSTILQKLEN
ncbi:uncharacterized protein [Spinacia oleracea]|uniref:CCHC-type domain-containing protein n=1 Tax=Spinacia oleracea TaxID=3562 RepID=A0ABM3QW28_SPIOL|nr:uncharacterized protein LOC130462733 [Spinacia oleracea]